MDDQARHDGPAVYQIKIQERLDAEWDKWLCGFTVTQEPDGGSLLTGAVADQAALHGFIRKLRDLHLTLLSLCKSDLQPKKSNQ